MVFLREILILGAGVYIYMCAILDEICLCGAELQGSVVCLRICSPY
jgi:hypothetical protein